MAQKTLTVALCSSMSPVPTPFNLNAINDIRDVFFHYFCAVLKHAKAPKDAKGDPIFAPTPNITWDATEADITDTDLVVYFRLNPNGSSIILDKLKHTPTSEVAGLKKTGKLGGLTDKTPKGVVSEVFVEGSFPSVRLAHFAMHELMHNKLEQVNKAVANLHTGGGGGLAIQGSDEYAIFTMRNCELMAENLNKPVKQNTEYLQPLGTPIASPGPGKVTLENDSAAGFGTTYSQDLGNDLSKEKSALDKAVRKKAS